MSTSILHYFRRKDSTGTVPARSNIVETAASSRVSEELSRQKKPARGEYGKYSDPLKLKIGRYALRHGNCAAARKFSKDLERPLNESTVRGFKRKFETAVKDGLLDPAAEISDDSPLPPRKKGRPLMLGAIEFELKTYIKSLRIAGCLVNSGIVVAAAFGIAEAKIPECLVKNGGAVDISNEWAKKFLQRMGWCKRKGTTSKGQMPSDFPEQQERMLLQLEKAVKENAVPPELLVNWDQTGINLVPAGNWTMDARGSQNVAISGMDDKREITAVLAGSANGFFLPPQLIYDGKTDRCHPKLQPGVEWPEKWHIMHNPRHWSNEESMLDYFANILQPYRIQQIEKLGLQQDQKMVVLFDVFRAQWTSKCKEWLNNHNMIPVQIPPNTTDKLQPMDLGVNKPLKDVMRSAFTEWYAEQVKLQMEKGKAANEVKVNMSMSIIKPLSAEWIIKAVAHISDNPQCVRHGFKKAGISARCCPEMVADSLQGNSS